MTDSNRRRRKDSAKLVWDTKPKRAPNPRDIEFQTAEIVIPNPKTFKGELDLPLLALQQAGITTLFAGQMGELPLAGTRIDKSKMNRLIWGDNLLAMQALLAQGYAGKIDLIYIDPPFLSSADYSFQLTIEGKQVEKEASIIERLAYTDTWEGGMDSYLDMMYPRLHLMKRLLSDKGSIYIHVDWHVSHYVKLVMDEVFGSDNFRNEIIWKRTSARSDSQTYNHIHDCIYFYSKGEDINFEPQYTPYEKGYVETAYRNIEEQTGRHYTVSDLMAAGIRRGSSGTPWRGVDPNARGNHWKFGIEKLEQLDKEGRIVFPKKQGGVPRYKRYLDEMKGLPLQSIWTDINPVTSQSHEKNDYPTQKPEALLERIIKASSNEGDLVADFFCGSGTTMAVAEKLGRRWLGCNLDKVGVQVSRNRMVNQQAQPFLLENIGNYQRHMIYLSGSKIGEMQRVMLKLYGAEPRSDRSDIGVHRTETGEDALVYVGYPDRPVTAKKIIDLAQEAKDLDGSGYKILIVLAWDYDYNYTTEYESRKKLLSKPLGVEVRTYTIPPEIYNYLKKAKTEADLESLRDKIIFHEKPYLRVSKPEIRDAGNGNITITIALERYVLMSFPIPEKQQEELRKVIKDNFAALIDYWAVDWQYDGQTFRSMWQAIKGNGKRTQTVITTATSPEIPKGKRSIAVRLVDVFGNDASAILEVR